jgi:hypothetical protein
MANRWPSASTTTSPDDGPQWKDAGLTPEDDMAAAAREELERACTLGWRQLQGLTPWGDTFEGFTPLGSEVSFERSYLWEDAPGSDIRVEITVFEPHAYELGVRLARIIHRQESEAT